MRKPMSRNIILSPILTSAALMGLLTQPVNCQTDARTFSLTFQNPSDWKLYPSEPGVSRLAPASGEPVAITIREMGALTKELAEQFEMYISQIGLRHGPFTPLKQGQYDAMRAPLELNCAAQTGRCAAVGIALNAYGRFFVLMLASDRPGNGVSSYEPVLRQVYSSLQISGASKSTFEPGDNRVSAGAECGRQPAVASAPAEMQHIGKMYFRIPAGWRREGEGPKAGLVAPGNDQVAIMLSPLLPAGMPPNAGWSKFDIWEKALNRADPQAGAKRETLRSPGLGAYEIQRVTARIRPPGGSPGSSVYEGWQVPGCPPSASVPCLDLHTHLFAYASPSEEMLRRRWADIEEFRRSVWFDTGTPLALPDAREGPLAGLYGGKYFFSHSGRVLIVSERAPDPDTLAKWQVRAADLTGIPPGADQVTFGAYEIENGVIRLHLLEALFILPDQEILACRKVTEDDCREKRLAFPFAASKDYQTITLGNDRYERNRDETGRKLLGKFKLHEIRYEAARTINQTGSLEFSPNGKFSLDEFWDIQGKFAGAGMFPGGMYSIGSRKGSGDYEIREHEIILRGRINRGGAGGDGIGADAIESVQSTMCRAFIDGGRDTKGRQRIQFGANIYIEGDDAPVTVKGLGQRQH